MSKKQNRTIQKGTTPTDHSKNKAPTAVTSVFHYVKGSPSKASITAEKQRLFADAPWRALDSANPFAVVFPR